MMKVNREASADSLLNNGPRSEYVKRYPPHPVQGTKSYRPVHEIVKASGPAETLTVSRRDFPEHPVQIRKQARPAEGNLKSEGPRDFQSSYQNEYPGKQGERARPYKPTDLRPDLGAFDGQASYREHYPEWELPKKTPREREQWRPPVDPFDGTSTNRKEFPEHQVSPRVKHGPDNTPVKSDVPFNASSDYKETYHEHPIIPKKPKEKEQWTKPVVPFAGSTDYHDTFQEYPIEPKQRREREQWNKPNVPMDNLTTQQQAYTGAFAPKQKSMRPDNNPVQSDAPLEGDTITSMSYKQHDLPKRYRHEPEQYHRPDGEMDLNTTNATQFTEHPLSRPEIQKPGSSNLLKGSGQMEKDTNYIKDYPQHPLNKNARVKPKNDYVAPTVPMATETEYQSDFYGRQPPPRRNYKPQDAPMHSDMPLDDVTDYRAKFTEHKVSPRQQRPKEVYQGPTAPLDTRTTVRDSYKGEYQPPPGAYRPDRNLVKSDVPLEDSTTMNRDFVAHDVKPREMHKRESYHKPPGDMDLLTSHNMHYTEKPIQKPVIEKPGSSQLLKGSGPMANSTNYQGDFIQRPIEKRQLLRPDNDYLAPTAPMDTETTHQAEYYERKVPPRRNFKPENGYEKPAVPIDDRTGYRDSFIPHEVTPRQKRPKEAHKPPSAALDDRTTVRDSYQGAFQPRPAAYRPDRQVIKSDMPFDDSTTMHHDFKEPGLPERYRHRPESYQKPVGDMDLNTTQKTHFREHEFQRNKIHRPESSGLLKGFGEMQKSTNYQGSYKQPPPVKRELVKAKNDYKPPTEPIEATTTFQSSFLEHGISPRYNFKPENNYQKPSVPIDDRTDYRDQFQEHAPQPRKVRAKEIYQAPTDPLESRTTANQAYIGTYQPKRESFRPDREYVKSDVPLDGSTTFGSAFKQWPTEQRYRHKPDEYVKPDGYMDLNTTTRDTYKEVHGKRAAPVRARSSHLMDSGAKFDGRTNYSADYIQKDIGNRKLVRPDNQYVPSGLPFDSNTTYRVSHIGYVAPKERSLKPDLGSDVLGQRDEKNPFRIKTHDWKSMLNMPPETTVQS